MEIVGIIYFEQQLMFGYKILYLSKLKCHYNDGTCIKKRRTLYLF
jgi:hypothetical protein